MKWVLCMANHWAFLAVSGCQVGWELWTDDMWQCPLVHPRCYSLHEEGKVLIEQWNEWEELGVVVLILLLEVHRLWVGNGLEYGCVVDFRWFLSGSWLEVVGPLLGPCC